MGDKELKMADGKLVKMEVDYSETVDKRLPECQEMAKVRPWYVVEGGWRALIRDCAWMSIAEPVQLGMFKLDDELVCNFTPNNVSCIRFSSRPLPRSVSFNISSQ